MFKFHTISIAFSQVLLGDNFNLLLSNSSSTLSSHCRQLCTSIAISLRLPSFMSRSHCQLKSLQQAPTVAFVSVQDFTEQILTCELSVLFCIPAICANVLWPSSHSRTALIATLCIATFLKVNVATGHMCSCSQNVI